MDIVFKEYEYSYQNEQNETERNGTYRNAHSLKRSTIGACGVYTYVKLD